MHTSAMLRQYAEECLRLAGEQGSEKVRLFLVEMAARWHQLAQERDDRPDGPTDTALSKLVQNSAAEP